MVTQTLTITDNDTDGKLITTVTVYVPSVPASLTYNVEPSKVVKGEIISQISRDRFNDPLSFNINNLGPGTASVSQAELLEVILPPILRCCLISGVETKSSQLRM